VLEIPIDPSNNILSQLHTKNKAFSKKEYSRSSFLIMKGSTGYEAYILTIIADSAYLKGNLNKLDRTTYAKRDAGFSGMVFYFTPKGKYVQGYAYKNGQLLTADANNSNASQSKLKTNTIWEQCTDYYLDTWVNDVLVGEEYEYSICDYWDDGMGNNDPGANDPPPPPHCPISNVTVSNTGSKLHVNVITAPPTDDGGLPQPNPTHANQLLQIRLQCRSLILLIV